MMPVTHIAGPGDKLSAAVDARVLRTALNRAPSARRRAPGSGETNQVFQTTARWPAPSNAVPSPLCTLPAAHISVSDRFRPPQPSSTPKTISRAEVVPPTIEFGSTCPQPLRQTISTLFGQVAQVSATYGLGDTSAKTFHIHYITRRKWLDRLSDFDRDRETQPPTVWARVSRWLMRLINAWTIPIEKDATYDIFIIAENFRAQKTVQQTLCLAKVLVQCLQRASHRRYVERQADYLKHMRTDFQNDTRPYFASKAMAEVNLQLCLDALERDHGVKFESRGWLPDRLAFWRRKRKPELQVMLDRLRSEENVDRWFRMMFEDESYAQLLFQKGGVVELSKNISKEEELFVNELRKINPNNAPRVKP